MKNYDFNTPILFLIFNRPDTTEIVFKSIQKLRPKQLFIASDGPRLTKMGEKEVVENLRRNILNWIDWECEVKSLFQKNNLGCKYAVSGAISWFFENVEKGIILEDDCLPDLSFFWFAEELLEKHKDNEKVLSICGYNPVEKLKINDSYFYSNYFFSWGWASWRRAWAINDLELSYFKKNELASELPKLYRNIIERKIREKKLLASMEKRVNSWAIPWSFTHRINNSFAIIPKINLIKNVGFSNEHATHTKLNKWDTIFLDHEAHKLSSKIFHPSLIRESKKFRNKFLFNQVLRIFLKNFSNIFHKNVKKE